jgi:hypothetical protein
MSKASIFPNPPSIEKCSKHGWQLFIGKDKKEGCIKCLQKKSNSVQNVKVS